MAAKVFNVQKYRFTNEKPILTPGNWLYDLIQTPCQIIQQRAIQDRVRWIIHTEYDGGPRRHCYQETRDLGKGIYVLSYQELDAVQITMYLTTLTVWSMVRDDVLVELQYNGKNYILFIYSPTPILDPASILEPLQPYLVDITYLSAESNLLPTTWHLEPPRL